MPPSVGVDIPSITNAITTHLSSKSLTPTPQWMSHFITSIRPSIPIPALKRTAEFRLLGTDITASLQSSPASTFPSGISEPSITEQRIPGPVLVQILDIEDIGRSRWSQVEAIEMEERGETRKGYEVIRVVADEEDNTDPNPPANQTNTPVGPHKLLVQDARGTTAYAFEMQDVNGINVLTPIGTKLVLKDFIVARGVILLTTRGTEVVGGKVDAWDKKWREDRKTVLKAKAGWREGMGI